MQLDWSANRTRPDWLARDARVDGANAKHRLRRCCAMALTALLGCTLFACSAFIPQSYGISVAELQTRLTQRMPYKKSLLGVIDIELNHPRLGLDPSANRLSTLFDVTLRSPLAARAYTGSMKLSGVPRYESSSRSVLLGAARLELLELDGLSPSIVRQVRDIANALGPEFFDRTPLHTFKPEDLRVGGVAIDPKAIRMDADRLIVDLVPR